MEKKELIDEGSGLNPIEIRVGSNSERSKCAQGVQPLENGAENGAENELQIGSERDQIVLQRRTQKGLRKMFVKACILEA